MNLIDRDKILDKIRDEVIPSLEFAELPIAYQIANVIIDAPAVEVNDYKSIIEKLTKENIELKNNFEIACKSTDVLYDTFLKVEAERDAAVNDIESLIHDDHMEVCDLCNLNQDNAFRCKATCTKAHWRGVNNKC